MRFTNYILAAVACGLMAAPLAAQDVRFGVQGAVSFPTGDLSDVANLGLQLGAHARWNFHEGHGLMARVDLTSYSRNDGYGSSSLGAGADYTYHLSRNQRGFYFLAGLSVQDYSRDFPDGTAHDSGLGLDLGAGYDLDRNFGLQARVTSIDAGHATLAALCLGVFLAG